VQNKDKYKILLKHIGWLQALAGDVAAPGPEADKGTIRQTHLFVERKYKEDFQRFHEDFYESGLLDKEYILNVEKLGYGNRRLPTHADIRKTELAPLLSILTAYIRSLHWGWGDEWVNDAVDGTYLAILLRLRELTGN